jgi:HD domain
VRLGHLAKRFFASLWPVGPSRANEEWVQSILTDDELRLWRRMNRADRRHAIGVARNVERQLGHEATKAVLAAALLHDVGKVSAGLGIYGRVVATLAGAAAGRSMAGAWTEGKGFTRKVGLYLLHASLGADMLTMAGSDPLTVTWAREHHLPEEEWTLPPAIAHALKAADDD